MKSATPIARYETPNYPSVMGSTLSRAQRASTEVAQSAKPMYYPAACLTRRRPSPVARQHSEPVSLIELHGMHICIFALQQRDAALSAVPRTRWTRPRCARRRLPGDDMSRKRHEPIMRRRLTRYEMQLASPTRIVIESPVFSGNQP